MKISFFLLSLILLLFNYQKSNKEFKKENNIIITISAAASLKNPLDEISKNYQIENSNVNINLNYGGSGTLERQIIGGAQVDIFISASKENIDNLEKENLIISETKKKFLKNTIVLIASNTHKDTINSIHDLIHIEKLALGEKNTVPAGKYGKEALEKLNLWDKIKNKVIYQKDVSSVLNIVELGEVDAGIVYLTDSKKIKNSFIVEHFSPDLHTPIEYTITVISSTKYKDRSKDFLKYLENEKSKEIFEKNGFNF